MSPRAPKSAAVLPPLHKLVAGGNDFLVADARACPSWEVTAEIARLLCRRHLGAGADGLLVLLPSTSADSAVRLFNCDGSEASFSGNGSRCAARLLAELGVGTGGAVTLETGAGVVGARVLAPDAEGRRDVEVDLAPPKDVRLALRLPPGSPAPRGDYAVVGVPYLAVPVSEVDALDLAEVAPPLRRWKELPEGANVAFYEPPQSPGQHVRLRTWERGVEGETLSSGTGCAIVALALFLRDDAAGTREIVLRPQAGRASVTVSRDSSGTTALTLRGDARLVAEVRPGPDLLSPDP